MSSRTGSTTAQVQQVQSQLAVYQPRLNYGYGPNPAPVAMVPQVVISPRIYNPARYQSVAGQFHRPAFDYSRVAVPPSGWKLANR